MRIDGLELNLDAKKPVKVATNGPITLSGFQTVDGIVVGTNDRVLVKDQTNAVENGIYVASNGAWQRAYDAKDNRGVTPGLTVQVDSGTMADTTWSLTTPNPNVGVTNLTFKKTSDAAVLTRTSDGVPEGASSLYFTQARARQSISVSGNLSYNQGTGVISYTTPSTSGITEGTNLYFTAARARTAISVSGNLSYNSATGVISYTTPNTDAVSEGSTNQYFTATRARNAISVAGSLTYNAATGVISYTTPSTSGVVEGSNLYYTDARARNALSVSGSLSYNAATGVISYTTPNTTGVAEGTNLYFTQARARTSISASGQLIYDSATGVVSFTTPAVTGDGSIPAGGSVLTLVNTGVVAGSYDKVTVNAKGLVVAGKNAQIFTGAIAQMSGTTLIPFDSSTPIITEGTQLFSQVVTPQSTASKINIQFSGMVDSGSIRVVTVAVFRGNTFIGAVSAQCSSDDVNSLHVDLVDSPATVAATTYSARIGASTSSTWYLGRGSGQTLGGANPSTWKITEIL